MPPNNENVPAVPGNVDQIRDIIFGGQMRDYDQRFQGMEERLTTEAHALNEQVEAKLASLGDRAKERFETLQTQLKAERSERTESDRDLMRELKELTKTVEKGLAQIQAQGERLARELRDEIAEQTNTLREQVRAEREQLATMVQAQLHDLRGAKADRAVLSELLTNLAGQLAAGDAAQK